MTRITTHVLDTAAGRPAAGLPVSLERDADGWCTVGRGVTDADGRFAFPSATEPGPHRMTFDVTTLSDFYPEVSIVFVVSAGESHYHVPLLLSPFGYSTYRGS